MMKPDKLNNMWRIGHEHACLKKQVGGFPVQVVVVYFLVTRPFPPEIKKGNGAMGNKNVKPEKHLENSTMDIGGWGAVPSEWNAHAGVHPNYEVAYIR